MKHAYLIMAHNEFYILEKLIKLIDDERNDIYLHIDKKVKGFDFEYFKNIPKKSKIFFTDRIDVKWGTNTQIECEYILFKEAFKKHYKYYHLLSGVDLPVASQDVIHNFFDKNNGKEFVIMDNHNVISNESLERIKLYHFFVPLARSKSKILRKLFGMFHFYSIKIQRLFKVNRIKNMNINFRKGANWVSITDEFVSYVLSKENEMMKIFKYSFCADELFVQTLLYNSKFYKNIYSMKNDDYNGIKRSIDWNRGTPYTFKIEDFEELINSGNFWARKFSTKIDKQIIDKIYEKVKSNDKN